MSTRAGEASSCPDLAWSSLVLNEHCYGGFCCMFRAAHATEGTREDRGVQKAIAYKVNQELTLLKLSAAPENCFNLGIIM